MSRFIDRVVVSVVAGSGGDGCASVHREKFKPLGGPDGGNGGHGASIIFRASPEVHTLLDMHFRPHVKAPNGKPGQGGNRSGASGEDVVVLVPVGTVVLAKDGSMLCDLNAHGTVFVAARGGRGGLGNAALASRSRKAPGFALRGEPGEERELVLELKSVADVGLIGYPSAGKSSLISVVSAAKPEIGDYPFTTLTPNLGVVSAGGTTFTIADVPGLIPGASQGKGLGLEFLRHIERCAVLAHVVDCATLESKRDPAADIAALEKELSLYRPVLQADIGLGDLTDRPRIIILNKIDMPDGAAMADLVTEDLKKLGWPIFAISALTKTGLDPLLYALAGLVVEWRARHPQAAEQRPIITITNKRQEDDSFTIESPEEGHFVVHGVLPERWVRQTQFDNDEAVGFLADRLAKLGVEAQLLLLGADENSVITIGGVSFDFDPDIAAGTPLPRTGRGTDVRLEATDRTRAEDRKRARQQRRQSKGS